MRLIAIIIGMKEYLEKMIEMIKNIRKNNEFPYSCFEEFVLKNGKQFKNHQDQHIRYGRMKECYRNAYRFAEAKSLIYVEGYATFSGIGLPVLHAWCADKEGNVYDPTWKKGDEYYGVPFDMSFVRKTILRTKKFGVIDNWEMGFPLLTGKAKDFLHKESERVS